LNNKSIEVYVDGPTLDEIRSIDQDSIHGYTFNPTLFRSLGVTDYLGHCRMICRQCNHLPVSLEVFADDIEGMLRQARILSALASNVYVKIPISFTSGKSTSQVIKALVQEQIRLNITAVFTITQVREILELIRESSSIISVFAGRLYDIGRDAHQDLCGISRLVHDATNSRVLWASPRMVYDYKVAALSGCDIITMRPALIKKLALFGTSAEEYSLETVRMFQRDAIRSEYLL